MKEQRRSKRMKVELSLEVSSVFKQDNIMINNLKAPIEVTNISRTGIGFCTEIELPIDYYFDAKFEFGSADKSFNGVLRILRRDKMPDGRNSYGCEFVGLASIFDYIFEEMEQNNEEA